MFKQHGTFKVEVSSNLVRLTLSGAWNSETAIAYQKQIRKDCEKLYGQDWAVLTLLDEWELCTPDCEAILKNIVVEALQRGMQKEAVVNCEGSIKTELFNRYKLLHIENVDISRFQRRFFADQESALGWLSINGFSE